jgi:ribosomal protein S18 acetylase RimI-like enzyme
VQIEEAEVVDQALLAALTSLLPQLSSSAPPPTAAEIEAIVSSPSTVLFVARDDDGSVVGSLTLGVFRVPTGVRAWIEDVVVDEGCRGQGVGASLVQAALERSQAFGARTVELTSRPSREAANRLYQRLGFERRETNVYRYSLGPDD